MVAPWDPCSNDDDHDHDGDTSNHDHACMYDDEDDG